MSPLDPLSPVDMVLMICARAEPGPALEALVLPLLARHGGEALDHAHALLLRLPSVPDALALARDLHASPGLQIAVHAGPVRVLEAPEDARILGAKPYEIEGLAKPLVARIGALCPPGRTLLSGEARARLGADPALRNRGRYALKGVPEPVAIWEDTAHDPLASPILDHPKAWRVLRSGEAWARAEDLCAALPVELDDFVGRDRELDALEEALAQGARLLTLAGPGGMGKTRLALRLARRALRPGGAVFADLSAATRDEELEPILARALGLEPGARDPRAILLRALAGRGEALLVLDNTEQATEAAARLVGEILAAAPELTVVVTTREPLGLNAERVNHVQSLDVGAGARLFELRARAAGAPTDWDEAARAEIRALVAEVDGSPLAIELAAARARVLTPARLRERLQARFKLLAAARGANPRHVSLRAAIDGSWEGLSPDERAAFARLSVFEGAFEPEAALAVIGGDRAEEHLDLLVQRSLVQRAAGGRLRLLQNLRAYAAERLVEPGAFSGSGPEARDAAERAHGAWFAHLGDSDALLSLAEEDTDGMRRRALALDDLRAACRRAAERGDGEIAALTARAAVAAQALPYAEALALLDRACASAPERRRAELETDRARALRLLGRADEAAEAVDRAVAGTRGLARAVALGQRAAITGNRSETTEAEADLREAITLAHAAGARGHEALLRAQLVMLFRVRQRLEEASAALVGVPSGELPRSARMFLEAEQAAVCYARTDLRGAMEGLRSALRMAEELGQTARVAVYGLNLCTTASEMEGGGELSELELTLERSLGAFRQQGDVRGVGIALLRRASLRLAAARPEEARASLRECVGLFEHAGLQVQTLVPLLTLVETSLALGQPEEALGQAEAAEALAGRLGSWSTQLMARVWRGRILAERGDLRGGLEIVEGARERLQREGERRAVALALAFEAAIRGELGQIAEARQALAEARALQRALTLGPWTDLARAIERAALSLPPDT